MTHATNDGSEADVLSPLVVPQVEIAATVAYSIALVKTPVRFALNTVLAKLSGLLRYIADKSARGVYTALGSAVNNKLTRRISPSVSYLDEKIENICTVSGRWAGNVLVFPFTLAFYFLAAVYTSLFSIVAYTGLSAVYMITVIFNVAIIAIHGTYEKAFLETKKGVEACKNMASKAAYILLKGSWNLAVNAVFFPVFVFGFLTFIKTLSLLEAPILAPAYMLSSVFGLDNRFNIYNYKSGIGIVHGYIQDIIEKKHYGGGLIPNESCDMLIKEATTGDIDSTNTVNPEQAATKLDSLELEQQGAQQQQHAAA